MDSSNSQNSEQSLYASCLTIVQQLGERLCANNTQLATAESCTGGMIAKIVTDVAGSSRYFYGGAICYANDAKELFVDVPKRDIDECGAVSSLVAEQMAMNCLQRTGVDYVLSTTGVAGPGGGTIDKPVGLVFVGLAQRGSCEVRELRFDPKLSRDQIRLRTTETALRMLNEKLEGR